MSLAYRGEDQLDGFKITKVDAGSTMIHVQCPRKAADYDDDNFIYVGDVGDPIAGGRFQCTGSKALVGQTIVHTVRLPWRGGSPCSNAAPKSGDQMVIVWHLCGGGILYPCAEDPGGTRRPAGAAEVFMEDNGSEWPLTTFKTAADVAAEKRQKAAELLNRKCGCGNFKTPGHADGLCNSCRSKKRARDDDVGEDSRPSKDPRADSKCPHCGKDLSELGPLRTERHVKKCGSSG